MVLRLLLGLATKLFLSLGNKKFGFLIHASPCGAEEHRKTELY